LSNETIIYISFLYILYAVIFPLEQWVEKFVVSIFNILPIVKIFAHLSIQNNKIATAIIKRPDSDKSLG
jgi:hypothetical protein